MSVIKSFINDPKVFVKEPLVIKKPHTTAEIRKIDEQKLNIALGREPNESLANLVRKALPKVKKKREVLTKPPKIPPNIKNAIVSLNLLDESIIENRVQIFIGYCKYKNYSYNTTIRYFNILKRNGVFGPKDEKTQLLHPSKLAFVDNGRPHVRVVSMQDFKTFSTYMNSKMSQYTSPILIALYTGLRTSEILQFSTYTLYQLATKQQPISIKRKQTVITNLNPEPIYWQPIYNTHLNMFVSKLIEIFNTEYESFLKYKINTKLFQLRPKTLGNRVKLEYFNATGKKAPFGFGIHSCRNMIAMVMAENSKNIHSIQKFLQHSNLKNTRQYIKADYTFTTQEFNRITQYEFKETIDKLNQT